MVAEMAQSAITLLTNQIQTLLWHSPPAGSQNRPPATSVFYTTIRPFVWQVWPSTPTPPRSMSCLSLPHYLMKCVSLNRDFWLWFLTLSNSHLYKTSSFSSDRLRRWLSPSNAKCDNSFLGWAPRQPGDCGGHPRMFSAMAGLNS